MRFPASSGAAVLFILVLCTASHPAAAANQYVVIAAEPPVTAFPLGQLFHVGDQIVVPQGHVVTLLGEDGSISKIEGPEHLVVTEEPIGATKSDIENRTIFERLKTVLLRHENSEEALGVTRSLDDKVPKTNDPWAISIDRAGIVCVLPRHIVLKRTRDLKDVSLSISADQKELVEKFQWPKESTTIELKSPLVKQAATLTVITDDLKRQYELRRLPDTIRQADHMQVLGWLLNMNCMDQAIEFALALAEG